MDTEINTEVNATITYCMQQRKTKRKIDCDIMMMVFYSYITKNIYIKSKYSG